MDIADALLSAADLHLVEANDFLTSGYWGSLGFALPAAVGAWGALPQHRPVVLLGDGSLLMSAIELATLARYRIPAIVVVFDNNGYGTERPMLDDPFNDVAPIDNVALAMSMGLVAARRAEQESEAAAPPFPLQQLGLKKRQRAAAGTPGGDPQGISGCAQWPFPQPMQHLRWCRRCCHWGDPNSLAA